MGAPEISQMKQALIKQGVQLFKLEGLSEEQLRKMCDEKLSQSLTGSCNWGQTDSFIKQYKYNITYTLPGGEKIKVAKAAESVLSSGRKVETFIDIAGNQYFQYRSADDKILSEDYFRKNEKIILGQNFKFFNNKLYKTDYMGNLLSVIEEKGETPAIALDKNKENEESKKTFNYKDTVKKVQYHPIYKDLMLNKQGKIDMEQFSLNFIKVKYSDKNYKIEYITAEEKLHRGNKAELLVTSKDGEIVCEIQYADNDCSICFRRYKNGKEQNFYNVNQNGIVTFGRHIETDGSFVSYEYEDDGKTIKSIEKKDKDGNGKIVVYKNNKISEVQEYKLKENIYETTKYIDYRDGKPFFKADYVNDERKNLLANKLYNQLHNKDKYGYTVIDSNIINTILNDINQDNSLEIILAYEHEFKKSLHNDIANTGNGLDDNTRLKLLLHLEAHGIHEKTVEVLKRIPPEKLDIESILKFIEKFKNDEENFPNFISKLMSASIEQNNVKSFIKLLKKVNPENVVQIMQSFPQTKILLFEANKILPDSVNYLIYKYPKIAKIACDDYLDLFSSINKISLSDKSKQKVINFLIKNIQKSDYSPIGNDMASHPTDKKKLLIDNMRILTNSAYIIKNPQEIDLNQFKGNFSTNIIQDGSNCWLVAPMISAAYKKKGNKKLQNMVKYNEKNKTFTVKLKNYTKTYTIDEITSRGGQLDGDYKARAIAMAFDEQFKETAYNKASFTINYDNEGNKSSTFFDKTLGNSHTISRNSISADDINNQNRCYTLEYKVSQGLDWHVVAIVGADDEYVYFQDPDGKNGEFDESDEFNEYEEDTEISNEESTSPQVDCGIEKMTWKQFRGVFGECIFAYIN